MKGKTRYLTVIALLVLAGAAPSYSTLAWAGTAPASDTAEGGPQDNAALVLVLSAGLIALQLRRKQRSLRGQRLLG